MTNQPNRRFALFALFITASLFSSKPSWAAGPEPPLESWSPFDQGWQYWADNDRCYDDDKIDPWPDVKFVVDKKEFTLSYYPGDKKLRPINQLPLFELTPSGVPEKTIAEYTILKFRNWFSPAYWVDSMFSDGLDNIGTENRECFVQVYTSKQSHFYLDLTEPNLPVVYQPGKYVKAIIDTTSRLTKKEQRMRVLPPTGFLDDAIAKKSPPPASPPAPQKTNGQAQTDKPATPTTPTVTQNAAPATPPDYSGLTTTMYDMSDKFAPYLTLPEITTYKAKLQGKSPQEIVALNGETQHIIISQNRTPYPGADKITADNVKNLQDWQLQRFCAEKFGNANAVPGDKKAPNLAGASTSMQSLQDSAANAQKDGSAVGAPDAMPDWIRTACKQPLLPAGQGKTETVSNSKGTVPEYSSPNGTPVPEENKWLKKDHLYAGAKGGMIGAIIGTTLIPFMGPWGIALGAAVGAGTLYGISKITE